MLFKIETKMQEKIKTILIVVLGILVLGFYLTTSSNTEQIDSLLSINRAKQDKIQTLLNDNHLIIQSRRNAITDKESVEEFYKDAIKDIEENHNLKLKNVEAFYRGKYKATGSGKVIYKDSLIYLPGDTIEVQKSVKTLTFSDNYLDFKSIGGYANYTYTDSLSFVTHNKKSGPFWNRKTESLTSIYTENENSAFKNFESVLIQSHREKKISLGIGLGLSLNGNIRPEIQLHYSLFKL
jgi:hypothetical protein